MLSKEKLSMLLAEFLGTALLASVVLVVSHMFGIGTAAWYISLSAGVALSLLVSMFGHVSGGHFNPAVTIGLFSLKKIPLTNSIVYIAAQLLGGAVAFVFYQYATGVQVAYMGSAAFSWHMFWLETVGAAIFGMGIASVVAQKFEGYHAAFTIGMSLTMGALVASISAAGFLNPAVALANNAWSVTYVIAPVVGMLIGMNLYGRLLAPVVKKKKIK